MLTYNKVYHDKYFIIGNKDNIFYIERNTFYDNGRYLFGETFCEKVWDLDSKRYEELEENYLCETCKTNDTCYNCYNCRMRVNWIFIKIADVIDLLSEITVGNDLLAFFLWLSNIQSILNK